MGIRFMEFNTNNYVQIRLTDFGRELIKKKLDEFPHRKPPVEDKEGWSEWQLHQVMYFFGEHCWAGTVEEPFETTIRIPV